MIAASSFKKQHAAIIKARQVIRMTAVMPAPGAHKIGRPVELSESDIRMRREEIESRFGTFAELTRKKNVYGLNAIEYSALQTLDSLLFLEGR